MQPVCDILGMGKSNWSLSSSWGFCGVRVAQSLVLVLCSSLFVPLVIVLSVFRFTILITSFQRPDVYVGDFFFNSINNNKVV